MAVSKRVLDSVVTDFKVRFGPRRQAERDWIDSLPTLADVIRKAGMAINSRGKRDGHHGRRKQETLAECTRILLEHEDDLRRSKDFDCVYGWVDKLLEEVHDVNTLYYYDVAVLIAMKLSYSPTKVHLHSGAADGAVALLGIPKKTPFIRPIDLPEPLSGMHADELEDLLCIYKACFQKNLMPDEVEKLPCEARPLAGDEIE